MTIDSIHGDYDCTLGLSCIMSRDKGTFPLHPIVLHTYSTHMPFGGRGDYSGCCCIVSPCMREGSRGISTTMGLCGSVHYD